MNILNLVSLKVVGAEVIVRVRIIDGREFQVKFEGCDVRVKDVLKKLKLSSEEYVVVKSGNVVTEEDGVSDGDELILYPVVSGG